MLWYNKISFIQLTLHYLNYFIVNRKKKVIAIILYQQYFLTYPSLLHQPLCRNNPKYQQHFPNLPCSSSSTSLPKPSPSINNIFLTSLSLFNCCIANATALYQQHFLTYPFLLHCIKENSWSMCKKRNLPHFIAENLKKHKVWSLCE